MDLNGPVRARYRHRHRHLSADHILGVTTQALPLPASSTTYDELSEDDVFWIDDPITPSLGRSSPPSPKSIHIHRKLLLVRPPDRFGVLGLLPEHRARSVFNHKSSIGNPTSLTREIPNPKSSPIPSTEKYHYHQSMPVNVPAAAAIKRRHREFEDCDEEETDDDRPMLPPHEIVARSLAKSQMVAFSVLEGAGRTLKGRDLRQVRNAVFRRTGFLD